MWNKIIYCLLLFSISLHSQNKVTKTKYNVLLLIIDDLRPELGCYSKPYVKSPNIDKLASQGILYTQSYCNVAVCGASRASLFTGLYPNRDRFLVAATHIDEDAKGVTTLPQLFKEKGYTTISYGKVFHIANDGMQSWTEAPWHPQFKSDYKEAEIWADYKSAENLNKDNKSGPAWEKADVNDEGYHSGKIAQKAVARLEALAKEDKPFFMAVGLIKPHLPFNAPAKYWDMYSEADIKLAPNPFLPEQAPKAALFNSLELRSYKNIPKGDTLVNSQTAKMLKHGYLACVSYSDALVGQVLDELKKTGLDKNTIVILLGDHGFSLGEHTFWGKHTCFDTSFKVPLIIKVPGIKPAKNASLISYVDLYPTICDWVGIAKSDHLQGKSKQIDLKDSEKKVEVVFSRFGNGETIITDQYAYTEYYNLKTRKYASRMLYDHYKDPLENVNVSEKAEYASIVERLSKKLKEHIGKVNKN